VGTSPRHRRRLSNGRGATARPRCAGPRFKREPPRFRVARVARIPVGALSVDGSRPGHVTGSRRCANRDACGVLNNPRGTKTSRPLSWDGLMDAGTAPSSHPLAVGGRRDSEQGEEGCRWATGGQIAAITSPFGSAAIMLSQVFDQRRALLRRAGRLEGWTRPGRTPLCRVAVG